MAWKRICNICKEGVEKDLCRILKLKKNSVIFFKDGRFHIEFFSNKREILVCENCSKTHAISELWHIIENERDNREIDN